MQYAVIPDVEGGQVVETDISATYPLPKNLFDTHAQALHALPALQEAWTESEKLRLGEHYDDFVAAEKKRLAKLRS